MANGDEVTPATKFTLPLNLLFGGIFLAVLTVVVFAIRADDKLQRFSEELVRVRVQSEENGLRINALDSRMERARLIDSVQNEMLRQVAREK